MSDEVYTEKEVNKMLLEQKTNIRLDSIETTISTINKMMIDHMNDERNDRKDVLEAIESAGNERREAEAALRREMHEMDSDHYEQFVKKTDLRLYAIIIVFAVTSTTGFINWLGFQKNALSIDKLADAVARRIK